MATRPRKSCIVLDLDETLIRTFDDTKSYKLYARVLPPALKSRIYTFFLDRQRYWGIKRPYLAHFLETCFNTFDIVGVWTASEREYAQAIVDTIFTREQPDFVWTREQCKILNIGTPQEEYYKPLSILFKEFPVLDPYNTLMLDNKKAVATYNTANYVEIPDYDVHPQNLMLYDDRLYKLSLWLRDASKDKLPYTLQDKSNIFTVSSAITIAE